MPSFVITDKCDGCKAQDKTACQYICPNDLMLLNKETNKAYNRAPEMCWECYNCVKICPTQAVEVRGYADFMPMGGVVQPLRSSDSIMWSVKFRSGKVKRFKFPIRTIAEGSAKPDADMKTDSEDIKSPMLRTEPESLGTSELQKL
ncbi:MAG: adenylyl-sulfate reductase subunit beta [Bacteroidetes bacterium]|jgi:adenylylsulfate reductase subunit B|nr:adenylyl-sulfate reductase subunit beta [Bacteroidota bacterium]MBT5531157.1 adenylyl-sulfate reductase subunit beta [Cytophagia bacterium]MBT3422028.1 adenylyl-sulfate reductase subunit beta [Bacteroidota bacterium]MBT3933670.1 adenylyl-sulfate reductase subunit beta [Bacteroidota bacterium]MBT4337350.1 adenylyl-sulfate reductase subunit beta [Bacteroidota bacterium]